MTRFVAVVTVGMLGATACSSTPKHATSGSQSAVASTPSSGSPIDLTHASAAPPQATDTRVTLQPRLYADSGNPCASVKISVLIGQAPGACFNAYTGIDTPSVPGQDKVAQINDPTSAMVARGFDLTTATGVANAFVVADAIRSWAIALDAPALLPAIEGVTASSDPIYQALKARKYEYVDQPPCLAPTSLRVAEANDSVRTYMAGQGWPTSSDVAVIATYASCVGITIHYSDKSTAVILLHAHPVSIVMTGQVTLVRPFGPLFVETGWAACGAPELRSLCG